MHTTRLRSLESSSITEDGAMIKVALLVRGEHLDGSRDTRIRHWIRVAAAVGENRTSSKRIAPK